MPAPKSHTIDRTAGPPVRVSLRRACKEIEPKTEQAKRLHLIRESLEINRDQIATRLGINKVVYSYAERRTTFPNVEF